MITAIGSVLSWAERGWSVVAWTHETAEAFTDGPARDLLVLPPTVDVEVVRQFFTENDGLVQPGIVLNAHVAVLAPVETEGPWMDTMSWEDGAYGVHVFDPPPDIGFRETSPRWPDVRLASRGAVIPIPGARLTANTPGPFDWTNLVAPAPLPAELVDDFGRRLRSV